MLSGEGEPGRHGGEAGDLRVTVNVQPHPWLERDGNKILTTVYASPVEAAQGARLPVCTVDGKAVVELPPGLASGTRLRMRGKGAPDESGRRDDQLVTVEVETLQLTESANPALAKTLDTLGRMIDPLESDALPRRAAQRRSLLGPEPAPAGPREEGGSDGT